MSRGDIGANNEVGIMLTGAAEGDCDPEHSETMDKRASGELGEVLMVNKRAVAYGMAGLGKANGVDG